MADVNIPITGAVSTGIAANDRLLTYEGWGVKKLEVRTTATFIINNTRVAEPGTTIEYPAIGASLPCVFNVNFITDNSSYSIRVVEYGAQPDPDYFNITGVDEEGEPVYKETANAEP